MQQRDKEEHGQRQARGKAFSFPTVLWTTLRVAHTVHPPDDYQNGEDCGKEQPAELKPDMQVRLRPGPGSSLASVLTGKSLILMRSAPDALYAFDDRLGTLGPLERFGCLLVVGLDEAMDLVA